MAAAEARAAWQRAANRCFVQEDAKRAPKLACCPSSTSTPQHDSNNGNATNGQEHFTPNFVPLNWNPMNSNLPPDTRWWLQLQPSFRCHKDFVSEQHNVLEDELEEKGGETVVPTSTLNRERLDHNNGDYPLESPWMVSTAFIKKDETSIEERMTVTNISEQPLKCKVDMKDYLFQDAEFLDWKPGDRLISKKTEKASPDPDSPCAGSNKSEPWWRISDQDELASLVAQKSLEHIENCDLPRPTQTMHGDPFTCLESLDGNRIFSSSVSYKSRSTICDPSDYPHPSSTSRSMDEKYLSSSDGCHLPSDTEKLYSGVRSRAPIANDLPENKQASSETNSSRAQLLEALRHSQTRAREAEIAAEKAYNEKEHIVKLFFRQASHLFAYKQWLQMLQLESLCLQLRIKEHQIPTLFPVLPWMPLKGNAAKSKGKKQKKCRLCKYVAFAVGLGLAGAGLLLGWTLGWLLPHL